MSCYRKEGEIEMVFGDRLTWRGTDRTQPCEAYNESTDMLHVAWSAVTERSYVMLAPSHARPTMIEHRHFTRCMVSVTDWRYVMYASSHARPTFRAQTDILHVAWSLVTDCSYVLYEPSHARPTMREHKHVTVAWSSVADWRFVMYEPSHARPTMRAQTCYSGMVLGGRLELCDVRTKPCKTYI